MNNRRYKIMLAALALIVSVLPAASAFAQDDPTRSEVEIFFLACETGAVVSLSGYMAPGHDVWYRVYSGQQGSGEALSAIRRTGESGDYAYEDTIYFEEPVESDSWLSLYVAIASDASADAPYYEEYVDDIADGCEELPTAEGGGLNVEFLACESQGTVKITGTVEDNQQLSFEIFDRAAAQGTALTQPQTADAGVDEVDRTIAYTTAQEADAELSVHVKLVTTDTNALVMQKIVDDVIDTCDEAGTSFNLSGPGGDAADGTTPTDTIWNADVSIPTDSACNQFQVHTTDGANQSGLVQVFVTGGGPLVAEGWLLASTPVSKGQKLEFMVNAPCSRWVRVFFTPEDGDPYLLPSQYYPADDYGSIGDTTGQREMGPSYHTAFADAVRAGVVSPID